MRPGQGEYDSPMPSQLSQMLQTTTSQSDNEGQYNVEQSTTFVTPLLQYQPPLQMSFDPPSELSSHEVKKAMCSSKRKLQCLSECSCNEQKQLLGPFTNSDVVTTDEVERNRHPSNERITTDENPSAWQLTESSVATDFRIQSCSTLSSNVRHSIVDTRPLPTLEATHFPVSMQDNAIPMSSIIYNSPLPNPAYVSDSLNLSMSVHNDHDDNCISRSLISNPQLDMGCQESSGSSGDEFRKELVHMNNCKDDLFHPYEELSCNAVGPDNWPPIVSYRVYALSAANMPPPTVQARQVAFRVIKHARHNKTLNELALICLNCGCVPILPVTGQCGHTRCAKCIRDKGACPCGAQAPRNLHVNILIQELIANMLLNDLSARFDFTDTEASERSLAKTLCTTSDTEDNSIQVSWQGPMRPFQRQGNRRKTLFSVTSSRLTATNPPRIPMTSQARFEYARELLFSGRYREAAPHLARAAASSQPHARFARTLLAQAIAALSEGGDPRRLSRELHRAVRQQAAASWLRRGDLECALCCHTLVRPVTTPCGHTYCRTCIERALDYRKICPLCLRSLDSFNVTATRETAFVCAALASIDALSPPALPDPDVIPIFVCTVAYPSIPCPLFIFDPRYWLMLRRVLQSGSRKFGMVAYERGRTCSDYGTVLEVCDAVHLEDGRSILSTVGVSRFRVIERDVRDGCDVARIQPLVDVIPTDEPAIIELRVLATQISHKALKWLNGVNKSVRAEIESAFGHLPSLEHQDDKWWETSNGPVWLWWLIAILPLRSEIKILILSTTSLLKRMMAVSRTLDVMKQVSITTTSKDLKQQDALTNEQSVQRGT